MVWGMPTWVSVDTQGILVPARMLFARTRQPDPIPLPPCCQWARPLAMPAPDLADEPSANIAAESTFIILAATASLHAAGRQHPFLNASQACSRWCLSLKANKCFGALIYLHKYHLNYRGQEAQLEPPFLVN